jgi:hypothetical protein
MISDDEQNAIHKSKSVRPLPDCNYDNSRPVGYIICAIVLFGNDMFQMKRVRLVVLMDTAILASAARSLSDQISRCEIH